MLIRMVVPRPLTNENDKNRNLMTKILSSTFFRGPVQMFVVAVSLFTAVPVIGQQSDENNLVIEEIIVTARHREENLQEVPDSITAFDAEFIQAAGIDEVIDFVNLTPNVLFRETFRSGVSFITIRGITTAQQGWPPVAYIIDGVQSSTLDAINQGAMFDIERIEVIKGPQGALYGAGAIAGAINVVTKAPSEEFSGQAQFDYGTGNDLRFSGAVSGGLSDNIFARLSVYYRDSDGLIDDVDGLDLDFEEHTAIRGRVIFQITDKLSTDFKLSYTDVEAGAVFQSFIPTVDLLNTYGTVETTPDRDENLTGVENREYLELSVNLEYDLDFASFRTVASYTDIQQTLHGSASFRDPPVQGIFGPFLFGETAGPGQGIDDFQDTRDDFENLNLDVRLTSTGDQRLRWIVGASYFSRDAENRLTLGEFISGQPELVFINRTDVREDDWWGVYGQINYDLSDRSELTFAARYDDVTYKTTHYADDAMTILVPSLDPDGIPVATLKESASDFQPKVQYSFNVRENFRLYGSYSEGFRPGFWNTGNLTLDESTKSFELGFKSELLGGAMVLNGAVFFTQYSDQQISFITNEPPFRFTENVASSDITGFELELKSRLSEYLTLTGGVGYTDAETDLKQPLPGTPELTVNVGLALDRPISGNMRLIGRADYRYQDEFLLGPVSGILPVAVNSQNFINLRLGLANENWEIVAYAKNLLDERHATDAANFGIGYLRADNKPRSYGLRLAWFF